MKITNDPVFNPVPIGIVQSDIFYGDDRPGAASRFTDKEPGTLYLAKLATADDSAQIEWYIKTTNNGDAYDYVLLKGVLQQTVLYTDLTDGGAAAGTLELDNTLPAGAIVDNTKLKNITGFTGDTSAVAIVGESGGDTDRFMTGTPSVFTTAAYVDAGPPSGDAELEAATTVLLTITSATDYTAVAAGEVTIEIQYH